MRRCSGIWTNLREALDLSLDGVPSRLTRQEVSAWLAARPAVREVHDLHIWGLSTTETVLTVHLVCDTEPAERSLNELAAALHSGFQIGHTIIQIKTESDANLCRLHADGIV